MVRFELIGLVFVTMPELFESAVLDVYDIDYHAPNYVKYKLQHCR